MILFAIYILTDIFSHNTKTTQWEDPRVQRPQSQLTPQLENLTIDSGEFFAIWLSFFKSVMYLVHIFNKKNIFFQDH